MKAPTDPVLGPDRFDEARVLHLLREHLPAQAPIKDFVHHNPLHALQDQQFFQASLLVSEAFGISTTLTLADYQEFYRIGRISDELLTHIVSREEDPKHPERVWEVKNQLLSAQDPPLKKARVGQLRTRWNEFLPFALEDRVEPLLFRWLGGYLDQGNADWLMPEVAGGFLATLRRLEQKSFISLLRTDLARSLLQREDLTLDELLTRVVGEEALFENYLLDQQFSHRGWSGLMSVIEERPETIFEQREARLRDLILCELILEIDILEQNLGPNWQSLGHRIRHPRVDYFAQPVVTAHQESIQRWHQAFEWTYYDQVLAGVKFLEGKNKCDKPKEDKKTFQGIFCVDDRECSLRRHLEAEDPLCETFGAPGFFGIVAYFKPFGAGHSEKNCPAPLTPEHLIKELEPRPQRSKVAFHEQRSRSLLAGLLPAFALGASSGFRLLSDLMKPSLRPDVMHSFAHMNAMGELAIRCTDPDVREDGLKVGYQTEEMVEIVANFLTGLSLTEGLADLIYVVAHGGTTANNPHHAAYDCGACSGRPGAVNARAFAAMANDAAVREGLRTRGLYLPNSTAFIAAMHDTSQDRMNYYDLGSLPESLQSAHAQHAATFEAALDQNAQERARRFASIERDLEPKRIRRAIEKRALSYFEPRPELGHGSNALCFVGRRQRIRGLFLDRRAFLQSYDYRKDATGEILLKILTPLIPVCGGINLEYYYSRMDNYKMGCGTKLSHNVTGLIGVSNSSDGDVRSGLPFQMIENHDPVRLMVIVEQSPEVVLRQIEQAPALAEWFEGGWVHLVLAEPNSGEFYRYESGAFHHYQPIAKVKKVGDIQKMIREHQRMRTNQLYDATQENMPVVVQ